MGATEEADRHANCSDWGGGVSDDRIVMSDDAPVPDPPAPVPEVAPPPVVVSPFAHPAEAEFARLLDFYRIPWLYEPVSFALAWEGEHEQPSEMFTPDFYLPDHDVYIELTTMKQSLVTKKNRKVRRLRELYPDINVKLLYRRDYQQLLAQYGYGALEITDLRQEDIQQVLVSPGELHERVVTLGAQISADYTGRSLLLVGVLKGVTFFLADLARTITRPLAIEYLAVAGYGAGEGGNRPPGAVRILKDLDIPAEGQHLLVVEDVVNTGLTLHYLLRHLEAKRPASIAVVTLLDKADRRLVDVPLPYVGFTCPNEFVIGYGLDYRERYRNLPFLCVLKPEVYADALATPRLPAEDTLVSDTRK